MVIVYIGSRLYFYYIYIIMLFILRKGVQEDWSMNLMIGYLA